MDGRTLARVEPIRSFAQTLPDSCAETWSRAVEHPFVRATAGGTLPRSRFHVWIQQDARFVQQLARFVAGLIAMAPESDVAGLQSGLAALDPELALFGDFAQRESIRLDVPPLPACDEYVAFLRSSLDDYAHAFTAYYACERSYLDAWTNVRRLSGLTEPYAEWVTNWTSEQFAAYVDWLGSRVDEHAFAASDETKAQQRRVFARTVEFEVAFWDACWEVD